MKIGNLDLGGKQLLAPMAEITDASFRKIARLNGAGLTFTQMVSAKGVIKNNFVTLRHLAFSTSEKPIGVQLLGKDPDLIGRAVAEIVRFNPDVIDLNSGCPADQVTKFNMGAELLKDTKELGILIKSMVENASGIPVSVKLRLGLDRKSINVVENAKAAEDAGASMVMLHARTKDGKYHETPDWKWIEKVKNAVSIPVVGNGSVFEPGDISEMIEKTGCDSVMVARGALGNPFIFSRFNELYSTGKDPGLPPVEKICETVLKHFELMILDYGEDSAVKKMRKHIIWYFMRYPGTDELLKKIFKINTSDELLSLVGEHTENIKAGIYDPADISTIIKKFKNKVLFWHTDEPNYYESLGY